MHAREAMEAMTRIDQVFLRIGSADVQDVTQHDRRAVMDALHELRALELDREVIDGPNNVLAWSMLAPSPSDDNLQEMIDDEGVEGT